MGTPKATMDGERDTEIVAEMLPAILAMADRFKERAAERIAYVDFLSQVDAVLAAAMYFADDEFKALGPLLYAGAQEFEQSSHRGFVAMGRHIFLGMLVAHPEVLRLAAERAERALWLALTDGTLPAEFSRGEKGRDEEEAARTRAIAYVRRMFTSPGPPPGARRDFNLGIAPNCEGDILSHPPRILRDAEGFQRLQLKGDNGWDDHGVVEEVTRLERYGLVLVATDEQAFLMTASDFDTPAE